MNHIAINDKFEHYIATVYPHSLEPGSIQHEELQRCFYAAFTAGIIGIVETADEAGETAALASIERWFGEAADFAEGVRRSAPAQDADCLTIGDKVYRFVPRDTDLQPHEIPIGSTVATIVERINADQGWPCATANADGSITVNTQPPTAGTAGTTLP